MAGFVTRQRGAIAGNWLADEEAFGHGNRHSQNNRSSLTVILPMGERIRTGLGLRAAHGGPSVALRPCPTLQGIAMYEAYWGLQRPVFTAGAAREGLAASPVHAEALARLQFLRES